MTPAQLSNLGQAAGRGVGSLFGRPGGMGRTQSLFFLGVVVPTVVAALYYGAVASKRYVSEAQFVVRGVNTHRASGLDVVFQSLGISRSADDANAVQAYLLSRDTVRELEARLPLRNYFGRPGADLLSRFPRFWRGGSFERLYDYYLDRVTVLQSHAKGLTTVRVEAFEPSDAQAIAKELLKLGEERVNAMNERAQSGAVKSAEADVTVAANRLVEAQRALTDFRNREAMINPGVNSVSILETITALSTELAQALAQASEADRNTPLSPGTPALQSKIDALTTRIEAERAKVAGGAGTLAPKIAAYDKLSLERDLAEKAFASAVTSLEAARADARRQQIYIEQVVAPNLPDESTEPRRLRMIATVLVFSFAVTSVVWLLVTGSKEHVPE